MWTAHAPTPLILAMLLQRRQKLYHLYMWRPSELVTLSKAFGRSDLAKTTVTNLVDYVVVIVYSPNTYLREEVKSIPD